VIQKKKCLKKRVAKYIWHMIYLCKRCPVREKCVNYYKEKKARWDAKIDSICPKKVCIRKGYCKKTETPQMCAYMGPFKQLCEQTFNTVGQISGEQHAQLSAVLADHVSDQLKDGNEKQVQYRSLIDTNSLTDCFLTNEIHFIRMCTHTSS